MGTLTLAAIYHFAVAPDFETLVVLNLIAALVAILFVILALQPPVEKSVGLTRETAGNVPSPIYDLHKSDSKELCQLWQESK